MKRMLLLIACCLCSSVFAALLGPNCPAALPTNHPNFCASFKHSAECYCVKWKLRREMCQDMKKIHQRMLDIFITIESACAYQKDTTQQICIDDWNCYLSGGIDSNGNLCSGTGNSCQ